jgi:hypothetical protein
MLLKSGEQFLMEHKIDFTCMSNFLLVSCYDNHCSNKFSRLAWREIIEQIFSELDPVPTVMLLMPSFHKFLR